VQPPRGVLLFGPPGCGKTALANAIANECAVPFLRISAPEIVSGMSGTATYWTTEAFAPAFWQPHKPAHLLKNRMEIIHRELPFFVISFTDCSLPEEAPSHAQANDI
jgi:SpoVK/Ycf46/Vps4 family AAA+-type ATPase